MRMTVRHGKQIPELQIIEPARIGDDRGWFAETFNAFALEPLGIPACFRQDNESYSRSLGVLRGLHYQVPPKAQGKLVRCASGSIFDVAVDLRTGSPSYGKHESVILSDENATVVWIPEGFAHGFLTLSDNVRVIYKQTVEYDPDAERAIRWDDPELAIPWPVEGVPTLSARDAAAPHFAEAEKPFSL